MPKTFKLADFAHTHARTLQTYLLSPAYSERKSAPLATPHPRSCMLAGAGRGTPLDRPWALRFASLHRALMPHPLASLLTRTGDSKVASAGGLRTCSSSSPTPSDRPGESHAPWALTRDGQVRTAAPPLGVCDARARRRRGSAGAVLSRGFCTALSGRWPKRTFRVRPRRGKRSRCRPFYARRPAQGPGPAAIYPGGRVGRAAPGFSGSPSEAPGLA